MKGSGANTVPKRIQGGFLVEMLFPVLFCRMILRIPAMFAYLGVYKSILMDGGVFFTYK